VSARTFKCAPCVQRWARSDISTGRNAALYFVCLFSVT
jgi:hypothetical protein